MECDWERVSGDVVMFVDDMRACGFSKENSWQIIRRITSVLQYLGIQEAPRKCCPPPQTPGAWAGSLQSVVEGVVVGVLATQLKWEKGQGIVQGLVHLCFGGLTAIERSPDLLDWLKLWTGLRGQRLEHISLRTGLNWVMTSKDGCILKMVVF
jgi:hypothetical protein